MVLTVNNSHLQNKENALLKHTKAKHSKSKSGSHSHSPSPTSASASAAAPITRKPRSRSHIPLPTSSTPSPVLLARKHANAKKGGEGDAHDFSMMDVDMTDSPPIVVTDSSSSKHAIRLPRQLKRPASMPTVDVAALQTLDPELKNVPIDYVLDKLRMMGKGMLQAACSSTAQPPTDRLPRELEVLIHTTPSSFPPPSHIFAVYSRTPNDQNIAPTKPKKVTLHPAHGIVLAAHCAKLPPLPTSEDSHSESAPDSESTTSSSLKLPIVPLSLPSPNTFPLLLAYLYTKQPQTLFASLLPPTQPSLTLSSPTPSSESATAPSPQSPSHLTRTLAQTYTTQALLAHAARVHGLWANIVALGVEDEVVWKVVQIVWAILIAALEVGVSAQ